MNTRNILQQFHIQGLYMFMMSDMIIQNRHLSTTDTGTNITHSIIIPDCRMLIIRISIARLGSIPHHVVGFLGIPADQSTTTRSRNHLVSVKAQYTELAKRTQYLTIKPATHTLGSILYNRNTIFIRDGTDLINPIRHAIQGHRDNRLRITACFLLPIQDSLFQKHRVHIPGFLFRTYKYRFRS